MRTSSSGLSTGSGRKTIAFTRLKIALFAPMPSASVTTATIAKPGVLTRPRRAKRKSRIAASMGAFDRDGLSVLAAQYADRREAAASARRSCVRSPSLQGDAARVHRSAKRGEEVRGPADAALVQRLDERASDHYPLRDLGHGAGLLRRGDP